MYMWYPYPMPIPPDICHSLVRVRVRNFYLRVKYCVIHESLALTTFQSRLMQSHDLVWICFPRSINDYLQISTRPSTFNHYHTVDRWWWWSPPLITPAWDKEGGRPICMQDKDAGWWRAHSLHTRAAERHGGHRIYPQKVCQVFSNHHLPP
jgi:hypothetical protein